MYACARGVPRAPGSCTFLSSLSTAFFSNLVRVLTTYVRDAPREFKWHCDGSRGAKETCVSKEPLHGSSRPVQNNAWASLPNVLFAPVVETHFSQLVSLAGHEVHNLVKFSIQAAINCFWIKVSSSPSIRRQAFARGLRSATSLGIRRSSAVNPGASTRP